MAKRKTGGYEIEIDDDRTAERYSATLELYVGGMMAFAYPQVRLPVRDELVLLEAVARDLGRLIDKKRSAIERLDTRHRH